MDPDLPPTSSVAEPPLFWEAPAPDIKGRLQAVPTPAPAPDTKICHFEL